MLPITVGVAMLTVQDALAPRTGERLPHGFGPPVDTAKPPPVTAIDVTVNGWVPLLRMVKIVGVVEIPLVIVPSAGEVALFTASEPDCQLRP